MLSRVRASALALVFVVGCHHNLTSPGPGRPEDIASIRLVDQNGNDDTQHLPLFPGFPTTLQVRPYRADGSQITAITGGVMLTFSFVPSNLASAQAVADPLSTIVTATDPAGTAGTLTVTLQFPSDTLTKIFGPFGVLIH